MPRDTYGFFGPEATFTHQALLTLTRADDDLVPYATVAAALDGVRNGEVTHALVPIENSVEGGVTATLDNLSAGKPLMITREVLLPVQFTLFARPGTSLGQVRKVLTHPHAAAQCRSWLAANVPEAQVTEGGSTAASAAEVSDSESRFDAAICNTMAGEHYGLVPLAERIADNAEAITRFVLASLPAVAPARTGADKTTMVLYMQVDRSGALLEILEQFVGRGVNLCRIESRPTKTILGSYCFSVDAEGHIDDARMAETLMGLHRVCQRVTFLGSYPRADAVNPVLDPHNSDEAYTEAAGWLSALRQPER